MTMKIRTYTDRAREVPDGFHCNDCGAIRNAAVGDDKCCGGFGRDLIPDRAGRLIKCFDCVLACRSRLIVESWGGADDGKSDV